MKKYENIDLQITIKDNVKPQPKKLERKKEKNPKLPYSKLYINECDIGIDNTKIKTNI